MIPWGEWRPDVSDYNGQHSRTLHNVYPRGDGYGPAQGFASFTEALPGRCRGFFVGLNPDGTIEIFGATSTSLYILDQTTLTWGNASKSDTAELDYTGSTNIGNAVSNGGLAAAFDGTTSQAAVDCAALVATTSIYVGKSLATAQAIHSAKIYGSNNAGYYSSTNTNMTADLYGKQGTAPADGTDGTVIGTLAFSDTANESVARTITATDANTLWDHVWVNLSYAGAADTMYFAELELFGADTYSALPTHDMWQFTQFGSVVIAVNANDAPQAYTIGSSLKFADLGGSPPQARYITTIGEHVILSGLLSNPFRIAWSARSDATGWTVGTDGADIQDFVDGGIVRGVSGAEFDGLIFQDTAIRRLVFVGGELVFEISRVTNDKGLRAPLSLVRAAGRIFFLSASGFEEIISGGMPVPVGKERFDRTFFADWDDSAMGLMQGVADPSSTRVLWFYKSLGNADSATFDKAIVWDWALQRTTTITVAGEYVGVLGQPGATLDSLDSIVASIEDLGISLDDITGSRANLFSFASTTHAVGFLTGDTLEATLETPDLINERRVYVRGARPICDAETIYGTVVGRQRSADMPTDSAENLMNSTGFVPHRIDTRHVRFRNRIPAAEEWSYTVGIEPDMVLSGRV
jgi:hypothetical protein